MTGSGATGAHRRLRDWTPLARTYARFRVGRLDRLDPAATQRAVLARLVQYAAKVCARPSRLRVGARLDRGEVLVTVRYEGSAAPEQDSRLLEEEVVWHDGYYKSVTKVFGVGVQYARDLVGGEPASITLAAHPEGGCILSFRAPLVE